MRQDKQQQQWQKQQQPYRRVEQKQIRVDDDQDYPVNNCLCSMESYNRAIILVRGRRERDGIRSIREILMIPKGFTCRVQLSSTACIINVGHVLTALPLALPLLLPTL